VRLSSVLAAVLLLSCASTAKQTYESLEAPDRYGALPAAYQKRRIVILPFTNSAQMGSFEIIPDGDYSDVMAEAQLEKERAAREKEASEAKEKEKQKIDTKDKAEPANESAPEPAPEAKTGQETRTPESAVPPAILPGDLYREITETELFASGRFEIIPYHVFLEERKRIDPELKDPASMLAAAQKLDAAFLVSGDCTDFEIKESRSYWKVPLWAILLAASFAIKDDDFRHFVWYSLIRLMIVVPLDSAFWDAGIGWEDLDVDVDLSINLRAVSPHGFVVFSDESSVKRQETVRNLDLLVWKDTQKVRIQKTSAGRQIRFAAIDLVKKFAFTLR